MDIETLTNRELLEYKNKLKNDISFYDSAQKALKQAINSLFGSLVNEYCRWYSTDLGEAITTSGQLSIRWADSFINKYLNNINKTNKEYNIYSDTDSCYIDLSNIVEKLNSKDYLNICKDLSKFCDVYIQKEIKKQFEYMASVMNANENRIRMTRENIANGFIITGRKHYAMMIGNSKGIQYDKPKLKIVGLEPIKATIPKITRESLKEAIKIILEKDNDSLLKFIDKARESFYNTKPQEIALPRGVSDIKKYMSGIGYIKGTPINSRAAILYNHQIDRFNLEQKYGKIKDGDKMRFISLKLPNPISENVIGFLDELPEEFGLHQYIDYETQFTKSFMDPLKQLTKVIDWKIEETGSLESFFG